MLWEPSQHLAVTHQTEICLLWAGNWYQFLEGTDISPIIYFCVENRLIIKTRPFCFSPCYCLGCFVNLFISVLILMYTKHYIPVNRFEPLYIKKKTQIISFGQGSRNGLSGPNQRKDWCTEINTGKHFSLKVSVFFRTKDYKGQNTLGTHLELNDFFFNVKYCWILIV